MHAICMHAICMSHMCLAGRARVLRRVLIQVAGDQERVPDLPEAGMYPPPDMADACILLLI